MIIVGVFFSYMTIILFSSGFYFNVPTLGILLSISLFQLIDISAIKKRSALMIAFGLFLLIFLLQMFNIIDINEIVNISNEAYFAQGILILLLLGMLLYSFHLHVLKAQVQAESDFEKVVYEKSMSVDQLNEKIYTLSRNLSLLETSEKGIFNTTHNIINEKNKMLAYLEEYKMTKKDAPLVAAANSIEKSTHKILDLLEQPRKGKEESEGVNSFQISLHQKTKVMELTVSGYHYEIMLKGILFNIIFVLMEKLVDDIKNNVTNFEVRGLVDRDEVEKRVFGKVCKNNRLNTNITRIRSLLANEGLTLDLIESKDSMVRIKTISDKIEIVDN